MRSKQSDYVYHPPSGSSYPGKEEANPFVFYPPEELRKMIPSETDEQKLEKMKSALRQWERIYQYPGYPYRLASMLRQIAGRLLRAEREHPSINLPYYQERYVPEGLDSVLHRIRNIHDDDGDKDFDYARQGERPRVDIDTSKGNYLSPSEPPIGDTVKTKGEGANPDVIYPFPPTGGNLSQY